MISSYELPLAFGVVNAPEWLSSKEIEACASYRDAVRLCWINRRIKSMTMRTLAETAGLYASHVSDYLSTEDHKRNLPADKVAAFEAICGNRAITQWEMKDRGLTVMEEVIARKVA